MPGNRMSNAKPYLVNVIWGRVHVNMFSNDILLVITGRGGGERTESHNDL